MLLTATQHQATHATDCAGHAGAADADIGTLHASESLQAALREADLERLQKEAAEAAVERLEVWPALQLIVESAPGLRG